MIIAVASGKGGTGKTTIALSLARTLSRDHNTSIIDCDVEEPDVNNFIDGGKEKIEEVAVDLPVIDEKGCQHCGACATNCRYNALAVLDERVLIFPELCNGCGACSIVCPSDSISFRGRRMGVVYRSLENDLEIIEGNLDPGQAKAVPIISAAKSYMSRNITVIDSPPGSSCPVIEATRGSNVILLVSEPTRFGLHDLRSVYGSLKGLCIPFAVIENRTGSGNEDIEGFCRDHQIPLVARIELDMGLAKVYSRGGDPLLEIPWFKETMDRVGGILLGKRGGN